MFPHSLCLIPPPPQNERTNVHTYVRSFFLPYPPSIHPHISARKVFSFPSSSSSSSAAAAAGSQNRLKSLCPSRRCDTERGVAEG